MGLSSSPRQPLTAEQSSRHGTSGILIHAWPDHPCKTMALCEQRHSLLKSSRVDAQTHVPSVPRLPQLCFPNLTAIVMGANAVHSFPALVTHARMGLSPDTRSFHNSQSRLARANVPNGSNAYSTVHRRIPELIVIDSRSV